MKINENGNENQESKAVHTASRICHTGTVAAC